MGALSSSITQIYFDPFIDPQWIIALGVAAMLLLTLSLLQRQKGIAFRAIAIALFILALLNPSLLQKQREAVRDIAVAVIDESLSQEMGERQSRTKTALSHLKQEVAGMENIDLRVIHAPKTKGLSSETRLFDALEQEFADIPQNRRAGVIFITDGQVHDIPQNLTTLPDYGPIHLFLTGEKNERDRRIDITQNPSYGIVGDEVTIRYRVSQTETINARSAEVTLNRFDGKPQIFNTPIGVEQEIRLKLDHAGENIFELSVGEVRDELTLANNRTAVRINGVRDRLKVLLVSGKPHAGGRTWRDLLTSDPGVDLVHFTILREPDKLDATPQRELALIAFPFRELFEVKLYDFDLIVFDRYTLNRILPQHYFNNIANYVREGGALLEASGPAFVEEQSIYYTDIGTILPASPDNSVNGGLVSAVFKPKISAVGRAHPVTENLDPLAATGQEPSWAPWLRQVSLTPKSGDVLMTGHEDKPLLLLDRVGEGRVAQIASDHIWLWSRGFQGGGPHAELLRRTVHWLMKEPELDERALKLEADGNSIRIRSRDAQAQSMAVTMTEPDGENSAIILERGESGFLEKTVTTDQLGIYAFSDGTNKQKRFIIIGEQNPPELRDVLSSDAVMRPLIEDRNGGVIWLKDTPTPSLRSIKATSSRLRNYAGSRWIGLRNNESYTVQSVESTPLLPPWAWLIVLALPLIGAWWREGKV